MYYNISIIQQNPVAVSLPFDSNVPYSVLLEAPLEVSGYRLNLSRRASGGDQEVIGDRSNFGDPEKHGVNSLSFFYKSKA
jgi:hypothetical protein